MPKLWRAPLPMVRITAPQMTAIQKLRCRGSGTDRNAGTAIWDPNSSPLCMHKDGNNRRTHAYFKGGSFDGMREDSLAPTPEIAAAPPVHLAKMPASRMETKLEQTVEKALMPVKTVIPAAARGSRLLPA